MLCELSVVTAVSPCRSSTWSRLTFVGCGSGNSPLPRAFVAPFGRRVLPRASRGSPARQLGGLDAQCGGVPLAGTPRAVCPRGSLWEAPRGRPCLGQGLTWHCQEESEPPWLPPVAGLVSGSTRPGRQCVLSGEHDSLLFCCCQRLELC